MKNRLLLPLFVLISAVAALAQPANDNLANAWTIFPGATLTNGTTLNASREANEVTPSVNSPSGRTVWFNWTAATSGTATMTATAANYRVVLAVWSGANHPLSQLAAARAGANGAGATVNFQAIAGVTYRVMVDASGFFQAGNIFTLRVPTPALVPTISLTSPQTGQSFTNPTTVTVAATASSPNGAVTNVAFYANGALIGNRTAPPYSMTWANITPGFYTIVAEAADITGAVGRSSQAEILVRPIGYFGYWATFLGDVWKYFDLGTDPGAGWAQPDYNDTTWQSGPSQLGYGDGDEATVLSFGPNAAAKYPAYYFRRAIVVTNVSFVTSANIYMQRDDGVVLYLNGTEIFRDNMPAGAPTYQTFAAGNAQDDGQSFLFTTVNPALLVEGTNYLAAEIHQDTPNSSDISFDLAFNIEGANNNAKPTAVITSPAPGSFFLPGTNITITVSASDSDGTVTNVAFYAGNTYLGDDSTAPFSFTWEGVQEGEFTLTAIATDNAGDFTISPGVDITISTMMIVPVTLVASNSVWKYNDTGTDLGVAWRELAYNDMAWSSGAAELGYGDAVDGYPETTVISFGPDSLAKYPTYYFRQIFNVTNAAAVSNLVIGLMRDDGGVVYINGIEVLRVGMPSGPISYSTLANYTAGTGADEYTFYRFTNAANTLVSGANIIAVEMHQVNLTSSDLSFALYLIGNTIVGDPPTNTIAPFVRSVSPASGSTVGSLNSVQVIFSESVTGVDASDLLVNGVPATSRSGAGNVYTFSFPQPAYGTVNFSWAGSHGIQDQGMPPLPFDGIAASNRWSYTFTDNIAPTIVSRTPAPGSVLTNLTTIEVVFSETVQGVDAGDLLINGTPAASLSGSGSTYTFLFGDPVPGTVNITWRSNHGITDISPSQNPFDQTGAGATWTYTFQNPPMIIAASNSVWKFVKGTDEASSPIQAWRQVGFNDSGWSNSATPFYFGDPYTNSTTGVGTLLSDMNGNYQCIYLRREFVLPDPMAVSNFVYRHQSDDGFVAWINGVEVLRHNMGGAPTDPPFLSGGIANATEGGAGGAIYIFVTNSVGLSALVPGTNVLAVQAFNASLSGSSDFGFNMQFEAHVFNAANSAPRVLTVNPSAGDVFSFSSLTVTFTEPVSGVNASDLLVNGAPATGMTGADAVYTFTFTQPAFGPVTISWAANHGIADFDTPAPRVFDHNGPGASYQYTLVNPNAPVVATQTPAASAVVSNLTQVSVFFSKPVTGVDASDLVVNGVPAASMTGSGASYTFTFAQPPYGSVSIAWVSSNGIRDTDPAQNAFDRTRPGNSWSYTLIDRTAPFVLSKNPAAGANVTNLTQITVTFSENVTGVNASDLLVNGNPATSVVETGAEYTFTFAQPNQSVVNVTWAFNHGITDVAGEPNAFNASAAGNTWQYLTPDNVAPVLISTFPPPLATVRSLSQVVLTFSEPVTGVNASDLRVNGVAANSVSGSDAGPYIFRFTQPATGTVQFAWAPAHGITDLASPPNTFDGGTWSYTFNPNAVLAEKVVFNEIMFHPASHGTNDEWIELHNVDTTPINLTGWRITRGVDFTFPNVTIAAGGFLVVAANVEFFRSLFPTVTNVIGNWSGRLGNNDQRLVLETSLGEVINDIRYATEGDWAIRVRGLLDRNYRGWDWESLADGFGRTIELRNPLMPNSHGRNWGFSGPLNGTPGASNSVATTNIAPLISRVSHSPLVPTSTEMVTISARVRDEQTNNLAVRAFYRNASTTTPGAFVSTTMFDDGLHNDGIANDGIFAGQITAQTNNAIIEFYVQAVDALNQTNTWPAPARTETNTFGQFANAHYQVDDTVASFPQPLYKVIMTAAEYIERDNIANNFPNGSAQSDAQMNATFITIEGNGTELRYNVGIRERGAGSRGYVPPNHRVNVPNDRPWRDQTELNLNSRFTHPQLAGYLMSFLSGLDSEPARAVRLRLNNIDPTSAGSPQYGVYIHHQAPGEEMLDALHPNDEGGNVYRAGGSRQARLDYLGTNPQSYINAGYDKASNSAENDWNDLINLTFVLNNTPASNYVSAVRAVANVEQWMLYFAVNTLLVSTETSLANSPDNSGDDYTMYFAPKEGRAYLVAHDWDQVLAQGDSPGAVTMPLFRSDGLPAINRFMHHPEFEPIYFATLRRLCETVFAPAQVRRTLEDGLGHFVPANVINNMANFASNRVMYVLSVLPADTNAPAIAPSTIGGAITGNTKLALANSPYTVSGTLSVASGATLSVEAGTVVRFASGAGITVANGGRIMAEGTAGSPILFTRSGASGNWGNIVINGAVGSPESRITHARFEFNAASTTTPAIQVTAGTVFLDNLTFANTGAPYIHVDGASFVISHCHFPSATAQFELVHGNQGIKAGGRGIIYRNFFGVPIGYNDVIDFTGGNRPGQPTLHIIDNVFMGATDDILDLDGTDGWIEGNIFLHAHRNGSPDSASAISGGLDGAARSELTIVGNIFYDNDHVALAKEGNFYTFFNNTIVRQTRTGGTETVASVALLADLNTAEGAGMYFEGNIIHEAELLLHGRTNSAVTFTNNILSNVSGPPWTGAGGGNLLSNPLFKRIPALAETSGFSNWISAQVFKDWFSLSNTSPAKAIGAYGSDLGAGIALGALVLERDGVGVNDAVFVVGPNRTGSGIPVSSWPNGSGYTHYKWRLDGGPWSSETPVGTALTIPGFRSGAHRVDFIGKRDTGVYQDDGDFQEGAVITSIFSAPSQGIRINEVLASNQSAVDYFGSNPDLIELYNPNSTAVDLAGMRLTDDPTDPDKFVFPSGVVIPAGGYLTLVGNNPDGRPGIHIGFGLAKDGQTVQLYDNVSRGGTLVDSVEFGLQITDYSVGRVGNGWTLCNPTFGAPNVPAVTGNAKLLIINEVLASELTTFPDDFVEIYNPQSLPVAMGGLYFTDNLANWPTRSPVTPLTYIPGGGYLVFRADGNTESGADHLSFSLGAERGLVALMNTDLSAIDIFLYGPQTTDVSVGRVPNSNSQTNLFAIPTPGAPNPGIIIAGQGVAINEVLAANGTIRESDGSTPDWVEFFNQSTDPVNVSDYSFTDTTLTPRKYVFPAGTTIPGRGYLRLLCDGGRPASATNAGFNVKAEGGGLYLFDRPSSGGGLLNVVTYGLQAADFSIGRMPDGSGGFVLGVPTPDGANIAATLANPASVRINEWMADPSSGDDWFELWNPNAQPVAIGGFYLTDDLTARTKSPIPPLSFLGASTNGYQRIWADGNPASGANHANFSLSRNGESLGFGTASAFFNTVTFGAQGTGISEGRFPDGAATIVKFPQTASPGDANYLLLTNIVINEVLAHSDDPLEDAIEFRNLTASPVNIGGWYLSDAKGNLRKYTIPANTIVPANGYHVLYEYQFNNDPTNNVNAFGLSSGNGDDVYLSASGPGGVMTGYRAEVSFKASENGVSFGRWLTSDGRVHMPPMSARTFGQDDPSSLAQFRTGAGLPNAYPKVGPIVIGQIMYHPPDNGTNDDAINEFIELRNTGQAIVPLYDVSAATNTWRLRDAVDFNFPQGVSIAPGGRLLVVSFNPVSDPAQLAIFRARWNVPASIPVYGPWIGKLVNSDAEIEILKPDPPNGGDVPYVLVERVHYRDAAPWPAQADGFGASLQRFSVTGYGNDPTNWLASVPVFGSGDTDGDGLPDVWETQYGFNPNNPADANADADGDGMTNLQEYQAGTHPLDATDSLRMAMSAAGTDAMLQFRAMQDRTYTIEYKNVLSTGGWTTLQTVPAGSTRLIQIPVPVSGQPTRFYRVRTP